MAKQLNVSLSFTADTAQAKRSLQELQTQLNSLIKNTTTSTNGMGLTQDLMKATTSAMELKNILSSATSSSGLLDLGAFNQQLTLSGKKLSDYASDLNALGPSGQQTFANIAKAIVSAEMPLKRTNSLLKEFGTTLANTARWQISSSLLHGFMGAVSGAYRYAQDLNRSLNDIRIVTGQTTEQMSEFAENANKAAQALSTTTTEYTKASLIYYQQGLSDEEVQKRTDVTVKMANATGQSAQVVSDQLTAVWNNFYDGTKSLEYYADVMTALGATTASSTDEIAGGLEKFAAIGETIGLSYEYAASALATITSNTRQSEEVVGTALKTIFARIQGLNLGETLDDGTTLNKYSEALQKVGIDIFDQHGELKAMDDILDEMSKKWISLSNDQQVALAQTVAGVRQYTQLVALMDNWNNGDSDSMMANLDTAYGATGALQEQADIYAESWDAAKDRVTAAAEGIYQTLLDDKFFIGLTNTFAGLLKVINGIVDGLGGLPGVLSLVGTLLFKAFGPEISNSIQNLFYNLTFNTESAKQELFELRQQAVATMRSLGDESIAGSASVDIFVRQSELQDQLLVKNKELEQSGRALTAEESRRAQILMDTVDSLGQQILKTAELRQEQESITSTIVNRLTQESLGKVDNLDVKIAKVKDLQTIYTTLGPIISSCKKEMTALETSGTEEQKARGMKSISMALAEMKKALIDIGVNFDALDQDTQDAINKFLQMDGVKFEDFKRELILLGDQVDEVGQDAQRAFNELKKALLNVEGVDSSTIKKILDELKVSLSTTGKLTAEQIQLFKNFGIAVDESGRIINGFNGKAATFADGLTALGSSLMSLSTIANSIAGLTRIWTNEDLSTGEKMLQTLTSVAMILPALTSLFNKQNLEKLKGLLLDKQTVKTNIIKIAGLKAEEVAEKGLTKAIWAKIAAQMAANWYYAAAVAAILAIVAVISILINAYNEEANAAKHAAEKAATLKETYNETQQAAEDLKTTISDYTSAIDAMNKLEEGTLEYKQALLEANEQAIELLSKYKILNQYTSRGNNGQIIISQEGLDAVLEEQLRTVAAVQAQWIDAEITASQAQEDLDLVNFSREYKVKSEGDWEQTSKQIVKSIADYLKKNDLNELIEDDLEKLSGWGDLSEEVQAHIRENIGAYSEMGVSLNNTNAAQDALTQAYLDAEWRLNHPKGDDNNNSDPADNIGAIAEKALYNTYVSKAVSDEAIEQWKYDYVADQWTAAAEETPYAADNIGLQAAWVDGRPGYNDIQDYADRNGYTWETLKDEGFWTEVGQIAVKTVLPWSELTGERYQFYDKNGQAVGSPVTDIELKDLIAKDIQTREAADKVEITVPEVLKDLNTVVGSLGDMGTSTFANFLASGAVVTNEDGTKTPQFQLASAGMSQEEALYIQENWDQVTAAFSGVAEDMGFWTEMGFQSYDEYLQYAKDWIDKRAEQSDAEAIGLDTLTKIQQRGINVENSVLSGDLTSENAKENTDYIEMTKGANLLTQVYPELIEEAKVLSNTNLVGTEMWISALHKVQEKADELKLDGLIAQSEKIEEEISGMFEGLDGETEIEAVLLSDEFETKLDELLDKSYEIDVEIHAQAEQAFESFSAATSNMQAMASKIGEGYVVAAEDIRELNAVFPGIIQGMQAVGDGSVRLNSQVVQNAMNSANAEIQASGMSTIEQLENQAKILRAKQSSYMAMYEAALALSKGEGDAAVHTATLQEELMNIQALNDKEATDTEMDNAEAVATDSNTQAGITADNWNSAYESAANSAIEFAKTAISAHQAAQTGEATYQMGDFGVTYQGRNGQSSEAAQLAEFQSAVDSADTADDYAALAQQFLEAAESAGSRANDIEGMVAEIGATTVDLTHLIDNIGDGKGPEDDKDSGSKDKEKETKQAEKMNVEEVIDRYKDTEDALDDVRDAYDDASKAADRLYGAGRIAAMAKANAQLLKEIGLLKQKKKQAQEYLKLDKAAVDMAAADAGIELEYDASGNIVNYTHELSHLVTEYNDLVDVINEDNDVSDEEQDQLDAKKEKIDNLTKSIEKYEETQEQIEEIDNEIRDKFYEWQDNNFEMWSHSLEVSLDITDDFKEVLDILMTRTEGDFYKQAEGLALMGGQLALVNVEMGSYIGHLGMLGGLMATGSISPADFVEGLGKVKDGAFAAAQAIFELDQQMIEYYGNALAMAREEIDLYTDQLAQCTSVLEHYLSLMDLMGHQTDYKQRGIVLEGRVKTLKNELDALQMEADYMQEEADKKKRMLDRAILPTSAEVFKQQYEDALSAAMETQEEFLAKAEEYAEALNEQLENSLNAANQELEDALTGGTSFDQMITGMERLVSLEEEYLTTTNKIYETEKLMNKAQQEIDKTTNTIAKQRLKQFIAETEQLQEKSKLSKFELDVQQAKYDLLLAEIALEEAQNAKSQVRLQRDQEGNFGYVYTADSSAIADAEQELADRQNEFYNIALEGINTYAEKYAQTLEEMYDTLTEIDQQYHEGAFASEAEYLAAREAAISYYFEKLGQYSELYNIAIQLDSKATEEAWGSDYRQMVNSTDQWKTAVTTHATQVTAAFKVWGNAMDVLADQTKLKMDQLAGSVKKVTEESDALAEEFENEVMPKIKAEMSLVSQLTALYAALRIVVLGLAYAYMALGVAMTFCQMAASMGSMLGAMDFSGATDAVSQGASALGGAATSTKSSGGTTTTTSDTKSSSGYKKGDTIHIDKGDDVYDYKGAAREGASYTGDYKILEDLGDGWYSYGTGGKETGKVYRPEKYNTGGYTGEWGSYGKLAMLHEKELVLNAKDTENFLASMDLLDNIVSTIDLHTANQSLGKALSSPGLGAVGSETLEQTVTIEANFPGVSSRTEIEEAFSTLVNRASQYANRK